MVPAMLPVVLGVPKPPSVPGTAIINRLDAGDGELNLSITVPNNGGLDINYFYALCSDGTTTFATVSAAPSVTIVGLTNNVQYVCSATVSNALGDSPGSAVISARPDEIPASLP